MTRFSLRRPIAPLVAIALAGMATFAAPGPVLAMQILDAADHAELAAEISATGVNRITLAGDRIAKVVRAPDGYAVEHDAASGDLYLRPVQRDAATGGEPVTLFIGTESGFTYRLTLTPAVRESAQILIRNAEALPGAGEIAGAVAPAAKSDPQLSALLQLVRAVARREALPGYAIARGAGVSPDGMNFIETWRGPRFAALVFEAARPASVGADGTWPGLRSGLAGLAGTIGGLPGTGRVAALWLAAAGTGPSGGRLVVAVTDAAGDLR